MVLDLEEAPLDLPDIDSSSWAFNVDEDEYRSNPRPSRGELVELALADGEAIWKSVVRDTEKKYKGDAEEITALYEECGWGNQIKADGGYAEHKGHSWCGIFIGAILTNVNGTGAGVAPEIAFRVLPSTNRLNNPKYWKAAGFKKPQKVAPKDIQRGDIVCVVTTEGKSYGDHIVMALGPVRKGGWFPTLEGNGQGGTLGNGIKAEGVIKRNRRTSDVRQVIRLTEEHFVWDSE